MGTYVKGMETPTWCGECEFLSGFNMPYDEYHCYAPTIEKNYSINVTDNVENWNRPDWCPLVEVPEPHGRLIDEDNVIDAIHERLHTLQTHKEFIKKRGDIDLLGVLPYISKIQTVIEAEKNK